MKDRRFGFTTKTYSTHLSTFATWMSISAGITPKRLRSYITSTNDFLRLKEFKDINARYSTLAVRCGNDGCSESITGYPRSETVCPGCFQSIRTRCGNASMYL